MTVRQDLESYEELQESVTLLQMFTGSGHSLAAGRTLPASEVLPDLRRDLADASQ